MPEKASSVIAVWPSTTKPAVRSRATAGASTLAGGSWSNRREPTRVVTPSRSKLSFTEIGMPANGEGA